MKNVLFVLPVACLLLAGCATTGYVPIGPGDGSSINQSRIQPMQSGVQTQSAEPIFLEPGGRTICVFYGDNSGHGLDLRPVIEDKLRNRGYDIVNRPEQADYILNARQTYLGYCKDYPDQEYMGRTLGTLTGAGLGAAIGHDSGNELAWGTGLGIIGFVAGRAIDKAMTPDLYYGELSLQVKQRLTFLGDYPDDRPIVNKNTNTITVTKDGKSRTVTTDETNARSSSPVETGTSVARSGSGNTKVTTQEKVADFEYHQTTMRGVAKVVRTDSNVAVSQLADYFANAVAGIF